MLIIKVRPGSAPTSSRGPMPSSEFLALMQQEGMQLPLFVFVILEGERRWQVEVKPMSQVGESLQLKE